MSKASDLASSLIRLADFVTAHPQVIEHGHTYLSLSVYTGYQNDQRAVLDTALAALGDRAEVVLDGRDVKVQAEFGEAKLSLRVDVDKVCSSEIVERPVTTYRLPDGRPLEVAA